MKHMYVIQRLCTLTVGLLLCSMHLNAQVVHGPEEDASHAAEELWASIDFTAIRKQILLSTAMPASDMELYMKYLYQTFPDERPDFFRQAERGIVTQTTLQH